jgi:hypothetical protein
VAAYLVVYDYGIGGLWALVEAPSSDSIVELYPEVQIVDSRPEWMDDERYDRLELLWLEDDPPQGLVRAVVADRDRK